ncbi:signal transduction histidine kinase [Deinococcus metalli]|uniref:histidine kinase n=1 Tax=Deinococcus metalli TaxID=1141878 RepID=A0A7W8KEI9_9DEIO|nr:ATP-binding protein [Deinococcus metalli]MBB5376470.1 signal transduction histidine kinase [Deinococcus metalli]GHF43796.1 hypothetical protein GCM10017781_20310 [Deinococcus metalli]
MTSEPGTDLGPPSSLMEYVQGVTEALAASWTQRAVVEIILSAGRQALGAVSGTVLLVEGAGRQLSVAGRHGHGDRSVWQDGPVDGYPLISDVLRGREALYFEHPGALQAAYPDLEHRTGAHAAVATAALPMFLDGRPLGTVVLDFTEPHPFPPAERRFLTILAAQCAVALGRAEAVRKLEARVEDRTRQLEEERSALEAFTRFTELVGTETHVETLVRQAITLLHETCDVDVAYFEREGELFKATAWSHWVDVALLAQLQRGFPLQHSEIAQVLRRHTAAFVDRWNETPLLIEQTGIFHAVAGYPYFVEGELQGVLMMASTTTATWAEREKGIFRAVGRSLDLALGRAQQTTALREQRDALDARTQELSVANAELEAFSYSVSHDLRTPVRHMLGFLHLAREALGSHLDDRSARYLDVVGQAGMQMNALIDAMLHLSQAAQRPLQPQTVDLGDVMAQIQTTLLPDLLTRRVQWEVAPLPAVHGDRDALKQVLTELTENALKYTQTRDPAVIRVWAEDGGDRWGVYVRDNGLGFDPRYHNRLFSMFQRLHTADEVKGTGVGLASVRRLILKHGGQVYAEGRVGEGATFGFTLPKSRPAGPSVPRPRDQQA